MQRKTEIKNSNSKILLFHFSLYTNNLQIKIYISQQKNLNTKYN